MARRRGGNKQNTGKKETNCGVRGCSCSLQAPKETSMRPGNADSTS